MRLIIDTQKQTMTVRVGKSVRTCPLYSPEAFKLVSDQWLRVGWDQKYVYTFTWMGRPVIQLPEDMIRIQEVIYRVKPDVIVETGIAHGGSLIYYASICKAMGRGRVIGVDIDIRADNRRAIETHELFPLITLIEGDSAAPAVVSQVKSLIMRGERVLVVLDSCHSKEHVLRELEAYRDLVSLQSYLVATDGLMKDVSDVPRGKPEWTWDNPAAAAAEFAQRHPEFVMEQPAWPFNESDLSDNVTHWPGAWLHRVR